MSVELLISLVVAIAVIVGGFWALVKVIVAQFEKRLDDRFAMQEEARAVGRAQYEDRFGRLETKDEQREREHMKLLAELPREYVRREDHIRFETVINAKLDALYSEMRMLVDRRQPRSD